MCNHIHRRSVLAGIGMAVLGRKARSSPAGATTDIKPIYAPATAKAIADAVSALIAELRPPLREKLQFAFNDPERKDWHNFPNMLHPRKGVRMGEMNDAERRAAHILMQTMLSGTGYLKVAGIMWHDEVFNDSALAGGQGRGGGRGPGNGQGGRGDGRGRGGNPVPGVAESQSQFTPEQMAAARNLGTGGGNFGATLYFIDVFGKVGSNEPWGVQLDGHHLGVNLTVIDNREVTLMPTFLGSEPALIQSGLYAGSELFGRETRLALELRNSLSTEQVRKGVLADEVPSDIFTGAERAEQLKTYQGISGLLGHQRDLAEWVVEEYIGSAPPEVARGYRDAIRNAGLDKLYFGWIGPADLTKQIYFRLHSPAILIELEKHDSIQASSGPANHIHSIMRTPANDYGLDWMRQHHLEYDHTYHY